MREPVTTDNGGARHRRIVFIVAFGVVLGIYTIFTVLTMRPINEFMKTHVVGDLGDPLLVNYLLGWNYHKFSTGLDGYWDANFFYPYKATLTYSEHLFSLALFSYPLYRLTGELILTSNILLLFGYIASAMVMYLLGYYFTRNHLGGFISGFVFSFGPFLQNYKGHLHFTNAYSLPLTLFFVMMYLKKKQVRYLAVSGLTFIFGFLSNNHYAAFLVAITPLWGLVYLVKYKRVTDYRVWLAIIVGGILVGIIISPFIFPYLETSERMGFRRGLQTLRAYSPDTRSYLTVPYENFLYRRYIQFPDWAPLRPKGSLFYGAPFTLFPGLTAVFLAIFGLVRIPVKRRKTGIFWGFLKSVLWVTGLVIFCRADEKANTPFLIGLGIILLLTFYTWIRKGSGFQSFNQKIFFIFMIFIFIISQGPYVYLHGQQICYNPYMFFYKFIPGFSGIRIASRFMVMFVLFLSWLAAYGIKRLTTIFNWKWIGYVISFLLIAFCALEFWRNGVPTSKVTDNGKIPDVYEWLANQPGDTPVLEYPMSANATLFMFYSLYHQKSVVNAYSGFVPHFYMQLRNKMSEFPSKETLNILRSLGVKYIIFNSKYEEAQKALVKLKEYSADLVHAPVPDKQHYTCYRITKSARNFLNIEKAIQSYEIPRKIELGPKLKVDLKPDITGDTVVINPRPDYNAGFRIIWRDDNGNCLLKNNVPANFPFFITAGTKGLPLHIPVPKERGKWFMEIYPMHGKNLIRIAEVTVY